MLASAHRLRSSDAFRRAVRSGRRAGGPVLVVHVATDPASDSPARLGLVVSKAVGDAVTRNRVKRRLRHLARDEVTALPPGTDVVVRAQPAAATLSSAELGAELTRCLGRARRTPVASRTGAAS